MTKAVTSSQDEPVDVERYLRTDFLKALAHAMRSPLSVIAGSVSEFEDASPEERALYTKMAQRNVKHLARLATQFEWLAEVECEKVECSPEPLDAEQVASEVCKANPPGDGKQISIRLEGSAAPVQADRPTLARTLNAPVENALRFAKSKILVLIDTTSPDTVTFHVDDDGPGFASDVINIVADRYRSSKERHARSDLALGLSLARSYANLNRGTLTLGTSPLGGARCSITLPKA